ncbi:MAG: right-handed parallel beta-helix repeat-containing protein [Pseudonocardia sp.]
MTRTNRAWSPRRLAAAVVLALAVTVGLTVALPAGQALASAPAAVPPPPPPDPTPPPDPPPNPEPTPDPEPTAPPPPPPVPPPGLPLPTAPVPVPDPAAEAAAAAAELARQQAQEAAERAADLAAAQARTAETWISRGRPERMIVVRDLTVETVNNGRLTAQVPRAPGTLTLGALDRLAPDSWVTLAADAARLSAVVVLTPGASFDLGGVRTLRLAGGATVPEASSIYSGSGRLVARDVTVTSVDPATDQAMAPAAGRPFIVVAAGGRLDATDATFSDLGTLPDDPDNRGGVQFNDGATGALVRTTMLRNSVGLRLAGSQGVRLEELAVEESAGDGLVLQGDRGTVLAGIRAERNGANGVLVKGETSDRPITGITTAGNGAYGLAVVGQTAPRITDVTTTGDATGGLRVNRSTQVQVADFTAVDQPIGIFTHVGSTGLTFERLTISGGRRGVVVEKSTSALAVRDSAIDATSVVGLGIGGQDVTLDGVSVAGARTGVKVERGAKNVTVIRLRLAGGEDGIVANPGSTAVVVRDLLAEGIGNDAVRTYSPDTQVLGGQVRGADTGVVAAAAAVVSDVAITQVQTGLRARGDGLVSAQRVDVAALTLGVDAAPGTPMQLRDSRVQALESLRGPVQLLGVNELSLPPLNLLGAIGMPLVLLAIFLELMHVLRQRRFRRPRGGRPVPPVVVPAGA